MLLHHQPDQAAGQHGLVVDPRMDLPKQLGPIPSGDAQQLRLAARVEGQVGRDIVDAAAQGGPGVLALAAGLALQHARGHAQVRGARAQAPQVRGGRVGEARPVERRPAGLQRDFARGLRGLAAVRRRGRERGGAGLPVVGVLW